MAWLIFFLSFVFFEAQTLNAFPFNVEEIKNHIDEKFAQATVETYPFPHLTIENILPENVYNELLAHWPETYFNPAKQQSVLTFGLFNPIQEPVIYSIWTEFYSLVDTVIKKKIAELFTRYSFLRFNQQVPGKYLCNSKGLMDHRLVEERGPGISPHIDQGYIFAAMAIYFPALNDYNHTDLGTYFYIHRNNKTSTDICYDHDVVQVKSAPYKPNTLSVWLQTDHSWHSGPLHFPDRGYVRRFYLTLVYLSPTVMKSLYGHTFNFPEELLDETYLY